MTALIESLVVVSLGLIAVAFFIWTLMSGAGATSPGMRSPHSGRMSSFGSTGCNARTEPVAERVRQGSGGGPDLPACRCR